MLGAGQGIGSQVAHALTSVGARVAGVDVDGDLAADTATEVRGPAVVGEVTRRSDMERIFAEAIAGLDGIAAVTGQTRVVEGGFGTKFPFPMANA